MERVLLLLYLACNNLATNALLTSTYRVIDEYFPRGSWRSLLHVIDLKIILLL